MVKTPYLVACAVIVLVAAAFAYVELRPAPKLVTPATPSIAPAAPSPPAVKPAELAAPAAPADCLLPGPAPVAPDGGSASADDMKLAHDVIQHFVVQLEGYQVCRERQIAQAGASANSQQTQNWRDEGNLAVDEAQALARAFAAQLKIYHAKHPEPLVQTPAK